MLRLYYLPIVNDKSFINDQSEILYELLPFSIPWTFWCDIMEDENRSNKKLDYFTLGESTQCDTDQCYFTSKSPEILDWSKAYMNDNDTDMILNIIKKSKT